ncbi:hypothetical protein GCM10010103_57700 [Streptomyces paradoxus]
MAGHDHDRCDERGPRKTISRPGLPGDLPSPEVLWARWVLIAVLEATTADERKAHHRTGTWARAPYPAPWTTTGSTAV